MEACPSSLLSNHAINENAQHSSAQIDLSDFGLAWLEILQLLEEQEFNLDFIDSQENLYNIQYSYSDSNEDFVVEMEDDNLEKKRSGGRLED